MHTVCKTEHCRHFADTRRGGGLFCLICVKTITEEEGWALRMAARSPCFPDGDAQAKLAARIDLWGGSINGGERMWVFDLEGNGRPIAGVGPICRALANLEYWMLVDQIAANISRRMRSRRAA